jgi:hypothetical protein
LAGATLIAARGAGGRHEISIGQAQITPTVRPLTSTTLYDLASLTKVLATTWLAMKWATSGQLDVDAPSATYCRTTALKTSGPSPCVCSCAAPQDCHPGFACDGIRHRLEWSNASARRHAAIPASAIVRCVGSTDGV